MTDQAASLPFAQQSTTAGEPVTAISDKANILIVDDRSDKLLVFKSVLEELNQNVITAQSGDQALKWLLEHDAAVILLDVNMPGIDGFETAALIRKRKKSAHIPIIFITAYADEVHTMRGYSLGAVDYILSPIVPDILRSKVKVFVQLFHLTQQIRRQADERIALAREQAARAIAEESIQRANFLAEASKVMSSSLNADNILEGATKLVVPFLADASLLTLVDESGQPYRSQFAWMSHSGLRTISTGIVHDATLGQAIQQAVASGRMQSCSELQSVGTTLAMGPADGEVNDSIEIGFPLKDVVLYPLNARGRTRGALLLGLGPFGRRFGTTELALAEDIATRAAIALDNCLLYQAIQTADKRKNEFLAMLAHELRNPLAPIRHAVDVMTALSSDVQTLEWARGIIDRQSQQLVRLLDDLLDVSRITRGKIHLKVTCIDVSSVISAAVESSRPLIESCGHSLTISQPPVSAWVKADFARLTQIVSNLLNNAAKFTEPNGQIWLEVETENDEVVFHVRDSGIGIRQDMLATIFEPFTQENQTLDRGHGGLGIGLTVVRQLVELHGGSVRAISKGAGEGSEFVVRLPMQLTMDDDVAPAAPPKKERAATPQRIMVVDDNVSCAEMLATLLEIDGHEVQMAHDGPVAVALARTFHPGVILLDIGLPKMDGFEVARQLRSFDETKNVTLIALSGYGQAEDRQRSKEAGFDHHLVKPLDKNILTSLLALSSETRRIG